MLQKKRKDTHCLKKEEGEGGHAIRKEDKGERGSEGHIIRKIKKVDESQKQILILRFPYFLLFLSHVLLQKENFPYLTVEEEGWRGGRGGCGKQTTQGQLQQNLLFYKDDF